MVVSRRSANLSTDSLTGFGTKDSFTIEFRRILSAARSNGGIFSLMMIDVDHFKSINDGFGHAHGDMVLAELGARLTEASREKDVLFRYGGDEFTCILPATGLDEAANVAQRLLERTREKDFSAAPPLSVTLSIGVAQYPIDGLSVRELFDTADRRLYSAKKAGRNRVVSTDVPEALLDVWGVQERLLGRDREISKFMAFMEEASDKGRGFFLVSGPDGSGKGFFMEATASILELSGYRLLKITGAGTDPNRPHSAIASALSCEQDNSSVIQALYSYTGSSMTLAVFLSDTDLVDIASIDDLLEFYTIYPGWMIVEVSTEKSAFPGKGNFGGVSGYVRLGSLSPEDCRAWFRATLTWDPPETFLDWFHGETGGLPGLFLPGVRHLERRGYLQRTKGSFTLHDEYVNFPLADYISPGASSEINNLPIDLSPFIGREDELQAIGHFIDAGIRFITLKGMRGMGRRRLAIQAAGLNSHLFSDGICYIDASERTDSIPAKLAFVLALPSGEDEVSTVVNFLSGARVLLVFANVESNKETRGFFESLIEGCSGVTIVATATENLCIPGEEVLHVTGLSLRRAAPGIPSHAALLFRQAAERLAGMRFSGEMNLGVIEEICLRVNGSPLAIELAASWARVMSVSSINRRIRANPSFLRITDGRQTSTGLAELFQKSWEQLSEEQKSATARLMVFAGHFNVEEAEEVSNVSPELILELLDRSFLVRDDLGVQIPAATKDFLRNTSELQSKGFGLAQEMHCRFFAKIAEHYGEMMFTGREAAKGLEGMRTSFSDISLAWRYASERGRYGYLKQLHTPIFLYCLDRGRFKTGYNLFGEALDRVASSMPSGLRASVLAQKGLLVEKTGDFEVAMRLLAEALELTDGSDDGDRAVVLSTQADLLMNSGEYLEAKRYLDKALEIFSGHEMVLHATDVKLKIAWYHLKRGNYDTLHSLLPSVMGECIRNTYKSGEWRTRFYLGKLAGAEGDYSRARESFLSCLASVKSAGYNSFTVLVLNALAGAEADMHRYAEAQRHFEAAFDHFKRIGDVQGQAGVKLNMAALRKMKGETDGVVADYMEALALAEKAHNDQVVAGSLNGLAFSFVDTGELEKANSFFVRSALMSNESGSKPTLIRALFGLAMVDRLEQKPVLAAITAFAAIRDESVDAESERFFLELLSEVRKEMGEERMREIEKDTDKISLQDLLDLHDVSVDDVNNRV